MRVREVHVQHRLPPCACAPSSASASTDSLRRARLAFRRCAEAGANHRRAPSTRRPSPWLRRERRCARSPSPSDRQTSVNRHGSPRRIHSAPLSQARAANTEAVIGIVRRVHPFGRPVTPWRVCWLTVIVRATRSRTNQALDSHRWAASARSATPRNGRRGQPFDDNARHAPRREQRQMSEILEDDILAGRHDRRGRLRQDNRVCP